VESYLRYQIMRSFTAIAAIVLSLAAGAPCLGKDTGVGFQGIEFYGSSQIGRLELEKQLGLRKGSSLENGLKASERLRQKLSAKNIRANIDIADAADGSYYVTVDIMESVSTGVPTRKLQYPRRVDLTSDKPFLLLDKLFDRRDQLSAEGRPVLETYERGVKHFSDEPCEQIVKEMVKVVPILRDELFTMVRTDPDATRRSNAIEVLNWGGKYVDACYQLIPALDDASERVRVSAARFIFPRMGGLPDEFPITNLVEGFSHQLTRQSHVDRVLALRALQEIAKHHPDQIQAIKVFNEEKLKQLESTSSVPAIKAAAQGLLAVCANPPLMKTTPSARPLNEF
jgi:hypothetical protein